jgi:RNA polymerase sigma-70 factor, ECF subfamily
METSLTWLGRLIHAPSDSEWKQMHGAYAPLLAGWLTHAHVPITDQDDLIQDVLVVVLQKVSDFEHRGPGAFRAWLRGILSNLLKMYFRKRAVHPHIDLDLLADDESPLSRQWDRDHDEFVAARTMHAIQNEFPSQAWDAFRSLVLEGNKAADVAAALGMSVNSVLLAKSRILRRLREELRGIVE